MQRLEILLGLDLFISKFSYFLNSPGFYTPTCPLIIYMEATLLSKIEMPNIGKNAPEEILLFKWGLNRTLKGPVYLTKEGAKEIIASYEDDGRALSFDIEHKTFDPVASSQDRKSGGFFRLSIKEDGLYATDIKWVPKIAEEIKNGEWGWISPAIIKSSIGVIKKILNVALTNLPATKNIKPLLLSAENMMEKMPNETLITKVKPLKGMLSSAGDCLSSCQYAMEYSDGPIKEMAQKISLSLPDWIESLKKLLEEMDPEGLTSEYSSKEDLEKIQEEEKSLEQEEKVLEEKEDDAIGGMKDELSQLHAFCLEVTGKNNISEIKGKLRAMRNNEKILMEKLSQSKKNEVSLLVDLGIKEGKISPVEKNKFCSLSIEEVKSYLDSSISFSNHSVKQKIEPIHSSEQVSTLSAPKALSFEQLSEIIPNFDKLFEKKGV